MFTHHLSSLTVVGSILQRRIRKNYTPQTYGNVEIYPEYLQGVYTYAGHPFRFNCKRL